MSLPPTSSSQPPSSPPSSSRVPSPIPHAAAPEDLGPIPYFPPPRKPGRTIAAAFGAVAVLAALAIAGGWWFVGNRLDDEIDSLAARLAREGGKLEATQRTRAGFPFHPTVVLAKPAVVLPPGDRKSTRLNSSH